MFRPIRRKKKEIPIERAKQLLKTERRGVLAVNGDDGYPYCVPVNFLYSEEKNRIYIHGAAAGHKWDSLQRSDKVCFTCYGNERVKEEAWAPYLDSTVVFGRCHILEDREETLALTRAVAEKYYSDKSLVDGELERSGKAVRIYVIDIEHMSAKELQER